MGHRRTVPKNTTDIIRRAAKIYELLIEFCNQSHVIATRSMNHPLRHHETHCASTSVGMIRVVQLIAYNNYAEICYELGNYVNYKKCMDVFQYLVASSWSHYFTAEESGSCDSILNELKLNVYMYKLCPMPTLAPAA